MEKERLKNMKKIYIFKNEKIVNTEQIKFHGTVTRDDPKVLIVILYLCPETFLRRISCTIQKNKRLPL